MIWAPPGSVVCPHTPGPLGPLAAGFEVVLRFDGWDGPLGWLAPDGADGAEGGVAELTALGGDGGVAGLGADGSEASDASLDPDASDALDAARAWLMPQRLGDT